MIWCHMGMICVPDNYGRKLMCSMHIDGKQENVQEPTVMIFLATLYL
jgi:hypothetical protein